MLFSFLSVTRELEANAYDRLHTEAQNYSLGVFARLQLAQKLLRQRTSTQTLPDFDRYFSRTEAVAASAPPLRIERGDENPSGEAPGVWLSVADPGQPGRLAGRVDAGFLFGGSDLFAVGISYCVLDSQHLPLFCPSRIPAAGRAAWFDAFASNSSGRFSFAGTDGDEHMASYFTVPLEDNFSDAGFSVAASQSRGLALSAADGFKQAMLPGIGIIVLLTLWLGLRLVKGRLKPLENLTDSATSMARGDLSTPIRIDTDDEFGVLGTAFERARQALSSQFSILNALSELDRAVLKNAEPGDVYGAVLRYVFDICGCSSAYVLSGTKGDRKGASVYTGDKGSRVRRYDAPESIDWQNLTTPGSHWYEREQALELLGGVVDADPAEHFSVTLVSGPSSSQTLLVLGFATSADRVPQRTLSDLVDRIAVAERSLEHAKQLYAQAHFDNLTGLPNRQLFMDRLEQAVALADGRDRTSALLFVDLDNFKSVNDSRGHPVGDALLRLTAQRIRRAVSRKDTVARLGGDEFAIVLSDIVHADEAQTAALGIIEALAEPFEIESVEHFLGASIGIVMIPADGQDGSTLLRNADTAMYTAKSDGRGRAAFFEPAMNLAANEHVELNAELRRAIGKDQLELHYQPKVDLCTGEVVSAEALIRWRHPDRGFVSPEKFVPIAERSSLIVEIGEWVAENACRQLGEWQQSGVLQSIAINVSYRQLHDSDIESSLIRSAKRHNIDPSGIELEITESIAASDIERATTVFGNLRSLGFRVAIDDFGTGYSSFGYLTDMAFDTLKIDRVFLEDFPHNARKRSVVASIIQLGHALGKEIVAEGVETAEQRHELANMGCELAQGYLFSAPLNSDDFREFVGRQLETTARLQTTTRFRKIG